MKEQSVVIPFFLFFAAVKAKILLVAAITIASSLTAQESIDLLTVTGRYGLPQPHNHSVPGEATESGLLVNAKVPVVLSEKTIWFSNLSYTFSQVNHETGIDGFNIPSTKLHGFILQTGLVQRLDEKRAFQLLFVPRFMSDFVNPGSDAWQFGAVGLYEHRFSEKFRLRAGAMFNQEMSGPLLVPLVDVLWQMGERWNLSGLLPIYGKLNYKVSDRFSTGIAYFGLITSYALSESYNRHTYMERTSIDFTLFGRLKAYGNIYIEGRLGYALDRNYEQYHKNENIDLRVSILKLGDHRGEPKNITFRDGPIAELRLVYNLPIDGQ